MAPHPHPQVDEAPEPRRMVEKFKHYVFTRALHSFPSFAYYRAAPAVIPLLAKTTSHHPYHPAKSRSTSHPPFACFFRRRPSSPTLLIHSLNLSEPPQHSLIHSTCQLFPFQLFYAHLHSELYPFESLLSNF